jgi:hypothetical protein
LQIRTCVLTLRRASCAMLSILINIAWIPSSLLETSSPSAFACHRLRLPRYQLSWCTNGRFRHRHSNGTPVPSNLFAFFHWVYFIFNVETNVGTGALSRNDLASSNRITVGGKEGYDNIGRKFGTEFCVPRTKSKASLLSQFSFRATFTILANLHKYLFKRTIMFSFRFAICVLLLFVSAKAETVRGAASRRRLESAVNFGTADRYTILANSGISSSVSEIFGNIDDSPTAHTADLNLEKDSATSELFVVDTEILDASERLWTILHHSLQDS